MTIDSESLRLLVRKVGGSAIRETLSPLRESERQRQRAAAREAQRLRPSDDDPGGLEEAEEDEDEEGKGAEKEKVVSRKIATGKAEPKAPKAIVPDPEEIKDVSFDQIVNMMNMMRSGRSAKDPATKDHLRAYFDGLNSGERQTLFVLLSGLTQVLAGGVEGEAAPDPSEVGIKIKPRQAREDRPSRAGAQPQKRPSQKGEPPPIVVGERADRDDERRLLRDLRRDR